MAKPPSRLLRLKDVQLLVNLLLTGADEDTLGFHGNFRQRIDEHFGRHDAEARGAAGETVSLAVGWLLQPMGAYMTGRLIAKALPQGPMARRHTRHSKERRRVVPRFGEDFADGPPGPQ